tara:strand:- start:1147 stop:1419 length:273 start_codon:yes stop_codon:yes gene_type:complete
MSEEFSAKIDTQGLSGPAKAGYDPKKDTTKHLPMEVRPRRLFTPEYAKEMKILINEVLDERDGKRGISYFDTDHFKYRLGEDEPPYYSWE